MCAQCSGPHEQRSSEIEGGVVEKVWGKGVSEKEGAEKEQKPIAEDKLETNPNQLSLIAFDSSGEVGQS